MINQQEISIDWINSVSKANRNADKTLVEKVIRALLLLEGLVKQKLQRDKYRVSVRFHIGFHPI